jgi:hypothetical protein
LTPAEIIVLERGATDNHIVNNKIRYARGSGLVVKGGANHIVDNHISKTYRGIELYGVWYSWIRNNWIDNSQREGIYAVATSTAGIGHVQIVGNKIRDANQVKADGGYDAIYISDEGNDKLIQRNQIRNNEIWNSKTNRVRYAIYLEAVGTKENYNEIVGNVIESGVFLTDGIRWEGASDIIKDNVDFVTQNSGTATIIAGQTSVIVNHGIDSSIDPNKIKITVTPRSNIGSVWVDSVTTTQFTIHCSSAPASDTQVDWYAGV